MSIPGSEYLTIVLHAISQSFLIPVVAGLLFMTLVVFMELGGFMAESHKRRNADREAFKKQLSEIDEKYMLKKGDFLKTVEKTGLSQRQREIIYSFMRKDALDENSRRILARDILDSEEFRMKKMLDRTDLMTKLGPVLGLMGTLIPLGPGLSALGQGDILGLSQAVIIAFDTTVVGVAVGAISSVITRARKRWYERDLNCMEVLLELIISQGQSMPGGDAYAEREQKKELCGRTR